MVVYAMVMFLCGIFSVLRKKSKTSYALSQSWKAPRLKKSMRLTNAAALRAAGGCRARKDAERRDVKRRRERAAGVPTSGRTRSVLRPPRVLTSA